MESQKISEIIMIAMSIYLLIPSLFALGLVTGFIGTNTGGSALITIPVMVLLGISPQSAIASARVASLGTMLAGLRQFHQKGKVDYLLAFPAAILGSVGAIAGAVLMVSVSEHILQQGIGILTLVLCSFSLLFRRRVKADLDKKPLLLEKVAGYLLFLLAGMLGGFFGGQAIIATYIFTLFFHKTMSESIGTRKVSGLAISVAAIFIYGWHGSIHWLFALSLISGTLIGSTFGSRYGLKKGDKWMESLFTVVVVLLALTLIITQTNLP